MSRTEANLRGALTLWCVCLAGGCLNPLTAPTTRHEQPSADEPPEAPLVVQENGRSENVAEGGALHQRVLEYIGRVDRAASVPAGQGAAGPQTSPNGTDVSLAAHLEPPWPATQPAMYADREDAARGPGAAATQPTTSQPAAVEPAVAAEAPPLDDSAAASTQPPVIKRVTVRSGSSADAEVQARLAVAPAVNTAVIAAAAPPSLREFLAQWRGQRHDASFQQQLDARLLHLVAGDYEQARAPLSTVSDEQQALAQRFIEALIAIREGHAGDPTGAAEAALREIELLAERLRRVSELSIPTLALCREVRGFGQYDLVDPPEFPAGSATEFVMYCEVRDFLSEQGDDGAYYTRFDLRTSILTRAGDTVLEIRDNDIVDRCRNRRHDCFIPRLVRLPATLSPGEYVAKATLVDKLGEKVAESRTGFRMIARP